MLTAVIAITVVSGCGRTDDIAVASEAVAVTDSGSAEEVTAQALSAGNAAAEYTDSDLDGSWDEAAAETIALNETYTIKAAGTYVFSGTLNDGQIVVDAADSDQVQIVLNGASILCSYSAAIWVRNADKVYLTLADGTENTVEDGSDYALAGEETEPDGAVYSSADLTINGSGALAVKANYADGIVSKDDLKITGGIITVTAADDCIRGTDSVAVYGGSLKLTSGGDGIKASKSGDAAKGWVSVDGGTLEIRAESDGIQAETALSVNGGIIDITKSYEGLEGATIHINGGTIRIAASDDGTNSSGDSLQQTGGQSATAPDSLENYDTQITGGYLYIDAAGDGIDSNGDLYITGGTVLVSGPTNDGNSALDCGDFNSTMRITGGSVAAAGSSGMAVTFGQTSEQASVMINFESALQAGTPVTLCDSAGKVVAAFIPNKAYQSVIFSSPDLITGETYTIYTGGTLTGDGTDGYFGNGAVLSDGDEYATVTLSEISTTVGETGFGGMGQGGGHINPGGMPQGGMGPGSQGAMGGNRQGDGIAQGA